MNSRFLVHGRIKAAGSAWADAKAAARWFWLLCLALFLASAVPVFGQDSGQFDTILDNSKITAPIPRTVMLIIMHAEDERHWNDQLRALLNDPNPAVRRRAALAAGRIGAADSVAPLAVMLEQEKVVWVRAMAAFALGETELPAALPSLKSALLRDAQPPEVRARLIEALGKIAAAQGPDQVASIKPIADLILATLADEGAKGKAAERQVVLKGLTAVLRARPEKAGPVLVQFLSWPDPRVRSDTGNTLARLRLADGNERLRTMLKSDPDAVARANAARVLGATADKSAFDLLLDKAANDHDQRVRVSAIRSLGALKDRRAVDPLVARALKLSTAVWALSTGPDQGVPPERNELLEIATTLGNLKAGADDAAWVHSVREVLAGPGRFSPDPEVETALAKASPSAYVSDDFIPTDLATQSSRTFAGWQITSSLAQGLGAIAELKDDAYGKDLAGEKTKAVALLRTLLSDPRLSDLAMGDLLTAYAAFKTEDGPARIRAALNDPDFVVRGTVAGLLADLGPDAANERALTEALGPELENRQANDAVLSILDALGKQKTATANAAIKSVLGSSDILIRQRAIKLLGDNGQGDWSSHLGTVKTRFSDPDYNRALDRARKTVQATVTTSKGTFVIDLLPDDAPMTVDNFISLARRQYFDRIHFHRVVPNFVVQTGDPRDDGNGGPGYQIRCEINYDEYDRGAVGMALSGKDTGGSQWFVTHSPQPHLDGGYTVFGHVPERFLPVIDGIARGDKILSIRISESGNPAGGKAKIKR